MEQMDDAIEFKKELLLTNLKGKTQLCVALGECTEEIDDKNGEIFTSLRGVMEDLGFRIDIRGTGEHRRNMGIMKFKFVRENEKQRIWLNTETNEYVPTPRDVDPNEEHW